MGNTISEDSKASICTEVGGEEPEIVLKGPERYGPMCQGKESGYFLWALSSPQQTLHRRVIHLIYYFYKDYL